jgi:hypothetical protein
VFYLLTDCAVHSNPLAAQSFTVISNQSPATVEQATGSKALVMGTGHPIISSAITSSSTILAKDDGPIPENDGDAFSDASSDESEGELTSPREGSRVLSPSRPGSVRKASSFGAVRRTSSLGSSGGKRGSVAQVTAERKRKEMLATQKPPNHDVNVLVSITVMLGSFDRRIVVLKTYLPRIIPKPPPTRQLEEIAKVCISYSHVKHCVISCVVCRKWVIWHWTATARTNRK